MFTAVFFDIGDGWSGSKISNIACAKVAVGVK